MDALAAAGVSDGLTRVVNYAGLVGLVASFFSIIYAYSRQTFALSRAGYLPRSLSVTNARKAPVLALLVPGALGFLLSLTGEGATLLNMAVFGATVSYVLMMISHIVLRRREPDLVRPYRTPGGTVTTGDRPRARRRGRRGHLPRGQHRCPLDARGVRGAHGLVRAVQPAPPRRRRPRGGVRGARGGRSGRAVTVRRTTLAGTTYAFASLSDLLAKATPARSGDVLAGVAAESQQQRVAAQVVLADLPLQVFLDEQVVGYEEDDVTRLILDTHDAAAFAPVASLTVGELREELLSRAAERDEDAISGLARGLTPEMVAATSKLMRNADLIAVARRTRVVTGLRSTLGLPGRLASRLQPNHPTDDAVGVTASILDGLLHGCGDAVIGINPATDSPAQTIALLELVGSVIDRYEIPTQSCVLAHVTTTLRALDAGAPSTWSSSRWPGPRRATAASA